MKMLSVIVHLQKKKSLEKTEKQRNGRQNEATYSSLSWSSALSIWATEKGNIKEKENAMKNWFLWWFERCQKENWFTIGWYCETKLKSKELRIGS